MILQRRLEETERKLEEAVSQIVDTPERENGRETGELTHPLMPHTIRAIASQESEHFVCFLSFLFLDDFGVLDENCFVEMCACR